MQTFEVVESYLHRAAKAVVVEWLREVAVEAGDKSFELPPVRCRPNRAGPGYGIWPEWPITKCGIGADYLWDELDPMEPGRAPPTPDDVVARGRHLAAVIDVAVLHKGRLGCAIEIVHKHPTPEWKRNLLAAHHITLIEVCATGVLHHIKRPERLPLFNGRRRK